MFAEAGCTIPLSRTRRGPVEGVVSRILAFLRGVGEVWTEAQAMRRAAAQRYPFMEP